jgi:hypothetical protein
MNLEGLHHKEDHLLPGIKVCFWVIILHVINLDIKLWIAERMEEMFKQEILMCPLKILNVTNATTMETYLENCRSVMEPSMKENTNSR